MITYVCCIDWNVFSIFFFQWNFYLSSWFSTAIFILRCVIVFITVSYCYSYRYFFCWSIWVCYCNLTCDFISWILIFWNCHSDFTFIIYFDFWCITFELSFLWNIFFILFCQWNFNLSSWFTRSIFVFRCVIIFISISYRYFYWYFVFRSVWICYCNLTCNLISWVLIFWNCHSDFSFVIYCDYSRLITFECCSIWNIFFILFCQWYFYLSSWFPTAIFILRCVIVRYLSHLNCYWDIDCWTIWICNSYNTWLVTWCRSIWCRLPCVICTIWKVAIITNAVLSIWLFIKPNCLCFGCWNNICCLLNWTRFWHDIIFSWCLNGCFSCNISYWNLTCDDCSCFPICYSSCTNNSCSIWTIKSHDWTIFNSPSNRNSYWNVFLIRLTC